MYDRNMSVQHDRRMPVGWQVEMEQLETEQGKLEKKRKTLLSAPVGKQIAILVDDVNMPAPEEFGAQPPIELLRQFQDFSGFYDRKKL